MKREDCLCIGASVKEDCPVHKICENCDRHMYWSEYREQWIHTYHGKAACKEKLL